MQNKILRPSIKKLLILVPVIIIILLVLVISIPKINIIDYIGYPSAYSACRDVALHTQGWDVWVYEKTEETGSSATVFFNDGINILSCPVKKIESLWYADAGRSFQTALGMVCPDPDKCPKWDYHGVSP